MQSIYRRTDHWQVESDEAALTGVAVRLVTRLVKARSIYFWQYPAFLDSIAPGLCRASPEEIIAAARRVIERERLLPRRWLGLGGEVPLINARAAELLGRLRRRSDGGGTKSPSPSGPAAEPKEIHPALLNLYADRGNPVRVRGNE